jgi:hypothetical protein
MGNPINVERLDQKSPSYEHKYIASHQDVFCSPCKEVKRTFLTPGRSLDGI